MIPTWLHKEGNWFLLNKEQAGPDMEAYSHDSLIWHQCPQASKVYKGMWRLSLKRMDMPCGVCGSVCPDEIQALWKLHNWETLHEVRPMPMTFYGAMAGTGT